MKPIIRLGIAAVGAAALTASSAVLAAQAPYPQPAQQPETQPYTQPEQQPYAQPAPVPPPASAQPAPGPVDLQWSPPALEALSAQAVLANSFTFDRTMLTAAAGLLPDSDADLRQAVDKLSGVSVHLLRFGPNGIPHEIAVEALRAAYRRFGWKHLVAGSATNAALHDDSTDVRLVLDGTNVRGAVVLEETPRSLTLVTIAGNLNPIDLLHLRGHFGIPRFSGDKLGGAVNQ